uniref:Epiplakin 1 n=1 Tax=Leptobrachium leishanense TaxID=445787 RepID=A0A8C5Q2R8_9ANUR
MEHQGTNKDKHRQNGEDHKEGHASHSHEHSLGMASGNQHMGLHGIGHEHHHGVTSSSHQESSHVKFSSHHEATHGTHHETSYSFRSGSHHTTSHNIESAAHHEASQNVKAIQASTSIAGFFVKRTKEKIGIYQALLKKLVSEEVAGALLEAQAATGNIIDPSSNQKVSVEAAIQQGLIGPEFQEKLLLASKAVTGYSLKNESLSLFQAFKKGHIGKNDAIRFFEAQLATGGIIDHTTGQRVPLPEATKLNQIDDDMFKILSGLSESAKCYFDPNTAEDSTYQNLLASCITDADTGLPLLPLEDTLQGLRKRVTAVQLLKAKIIIQALYQNIEQGKQTLETVAELPEVRQYLQGVGSIGGIYIESTKEKISIYQAMKRNLLTSDLAVSLLEAQAASGFIVDPVQKKTFTVTEAVQEGLVGIELKEKLLIAERAITGFDDPYTGKKISLYQALKKELLDKKHGENLLDVQLATGGIVDPNHSFHVSLEVAFSRGLFDEELAQFLSDRADGPKGFVDPNTNEQVSYRELRKRCTLDQDTKQYLFSLKVTFQGLRGRVTDEELLESLVIDKETYEKLQKGTISSHYVSEQENVKRYLQGTGSIAGVALVSINERKSIYQAMKEHLLMPGTSISLLEAQAATGFLLDPVKNAKLTVGEAIKSGLVGPEFHEKLRSAEKATTGFRDPYTGEILSLFQAIKKGFVLKDHGLHLLEAQLATGGIIDAVKKHRVPEEVAYSRGYLDAETKKILGDVTNDRKGFFDPNLKENVTYAQLVERCLVDSQTGLYLIPIFDNTQDALKTPHSFIDFQTKLALKQLKLTVSSGKYKGQVLSLWDLLYSDYFTVDLRESLIKQYKSGKYSLQELATTVDTTIQELVSTTKITFEGLRESVTPGQLLDSEIIDQDLYEKLQHGETSAKDVVNIDSVKQYLHGTGSIGGLILTDTQEKLSIYQAKRKGILRPGTSLILLEAQAATGFIVDPVKNKKYSVDEALKANLIGSEFYEKLLSAEKAVTGYKDPYTGETVSLFQAMSKGLIVKDHGIRLLEAQVGTGGIIDPINSLRIPVEVAYKRGFFDKKMNIILSDPSDDTKGFFDPNTHENLSYLQLKERCINEPSTNLCLLPLHSTKRQLNINNNVKESFRNLEIFVKYGRLRGQTVSAWVLINSEYFTEWKRREIIEKYRLRKATLEQIVLFIEEELQKWTEVRFPALTRQVNLHQLLEYEIIDKALFEQVLQGKLSADDLLKTDSVRKCLYGTGVLGGVIIKPSNQRIDFSEASKRNILLPTTILPLLEAQAATGHLINPADNQKLSVDEALKLGIIEPKFYEKLLSAEEAATGYSDPYTGKKISLFQATQKGLVEENRATQLLEAQLATGGIIDPINGIHLPDSVAKKYGYLNEETHTSLSNPNNDTKFYYDPTTKQTVTYAELISHAEKDADTGVYLFPLPQDFVEAPVDVYSDEEVKQKLLSIRIEERNATLWELIHFGYFTEEQRHEILGRYKSKRVTIEELTNEILQIIKSNEIKKATHISFQGLRGNVSAVLLLDLNIINQTTFDELVQGQKSIQEVSELESVKKCLEGPGSISGVFLESTKDKISIYEAMKKNLILPANALMLLEAQVATGFLVDPAQNQKHSVEGAVKSGLVGPELHEKLLMAERAVTGYNDPYTGYKISLGKTIGKGLIPHKESLPLLQAQLSGGGMFSPAHSIYVPLQQSYKLGLLDEEISRSTLDLKLYFDPNSKENLTYHHLKERCYKDPETGHLFLSLPESAALYTDVHIIEVLKSATFTINDGRFKGQMVSLWELLNSEYISVDKLKELLLMFKSSSSGALQEIIKVVTTIIEETGTANTKLQFKGLRKQISASDLFHSEVIDKKTLDELNLGKKTIVEVTEMDNVKRYLEGTNCIAGVLIQSTNKKISIYEAMLKHILRPGTALVLLEAQAATGFLVDPVKNERLSVDEAIANGLVGHDVYAKLRSAERAVTGYTDPYTGENISLFQAMQKKLIVDCHGIRLLEAQIATGGIIDPVHSHRVPVEVAYKRGYFNEEMNQILSDPSDDTKGFFDPNTHENLTYLQLVERCIQDPETGLYLLQVVKRGENYFYFTDKIKTDLTSRTFEMHVGKFSNQVVSIWEVLTSEYVTDLKRRELVRLYTIGVLTIDELISNIVSLIEDYEIKSSSVKFKGIRGEVSASSLFSAGIIHKKTLDDLKEGRITVESVAQRDSVKKYLEGTSCIGGVLVLPKEETISISEAINRGLVQIDVAHMLLEAQAANGFIIDPVKNQRFTVVEAVSSNIIDPKVQAQLEVAEKAVTGFIDLVNGSKISLFQAMEKGIVSKEQALYLLETQVATGGVIDPVHNHRLPLEVAYRRRYLDEDAYLTISDAINKKRFVDPNTHESITYKGLLERCTKDANSGLYLLPLAEKRNDYFYIDEQTKQLLTTTIVRVNAGKFKDQEVSLWELLCSSYISEDKRKDLVKVYKAKTSSTLKDILDIIIKLIQEKDRSQNDIWFQGLRKQIKASELYNAEIISKETLEGLQQQTESVTDVAKLDSVRRYLEGTSSISGVLVSSRKDPTIKEKMSIYDAMLKNILRPGTALVLLEAQAATGFVIDPVKNKKLSVDEALSAGLIGYEIYKKLLSAEQGVTGYSDPYTGNKISLFQAMKKDLIVKDHGIRLLEAQIATGGIIDPVHSHRVPVEVAYKRGYFDEEVNQILSDSSDDPKGFFDPNTHENLTYLQLLERCHQDPDTGLYLLDVTDTKSSSPVKSQTLLQSRTIQVTTGYFKGKNVSVWELLYSKYISAEKQEELLKKFTSGILSLEELITILITIIKQTAETKDTTDSVDHDEQTKLLLQSENVTVSVGDFIGQSVSLWDLLHSHYITEDKRKDLLEKIKSQTLSIQDLINVIITIITEVEISKIEKQQETTDVTAEPSEEAESLANNDEIETALQSITIEIQKGELQGQENSIWDLLYSKYIPEGIRKELLEDYRLTVKAIIDVIHQTVKEVEHERREAILTRYSLKEEVFNIIQGVQVEVSVGEFKGQTLSVWDLLSSKYFSEEKKKEWLDKLNSGEIHVNELIKIIIMIIEETEERSKKIKFKGLRRQITANELLRSEIIDQGTLLELAQGRKSLEEVTQLETVKRYLEGRSCIAGVLVPSIKDPSKKEKMTIYDAMIRKILRPGTALVLLEAQAATGFIIDPVKNLKLSVEEAENAGVFGHELRAKLLSAERGVTGYTDPYTGDKISLFQAMQKDLIVKDHGIRLLEAQIATGGIIDPVHSHRVPVEVAYKRGYFNEAMNQILSDPTDDTKGFFDPNTHENLTYLQLLQRCVPDSDTGLCMLEIKEKTTPSAQPWERSLKAQTIQIKVGQYSDQNISVWELLNSEYFRKITEKDELLKKFQSGTITIEELVTTITTIIEEWEKQKSSQHVNGTGPSQSEQPKNQSELHTELVSVTDGKFQGQKLSVWDLLNSDYFTERKREEILQKYAAGKLTREAITKIITEIISEADVITVTKVETDVAAPSPVHSQIDEQLRKALNAISVKVEAGKSEKVSLWEILHSEYFPKEKREGQLDKHRSTVDRLKQVILKFVEGTEVRSDDDIQRTLEVKTTEVRVGEFKDQKLSVWDLLHSKYISGEKRQELLGKYRSGSLTEDELLRIIIAIIEETEERIASLEFQGLRTKVSAKELLESSIIDQSTMNELLQGSRTLEQVTQMDSVKRYLEGTNCIAGVFVTSKADPSKRENLSIYDAMLRRVLRPGTALVLLEAQAATGFVIDPIRNKKLSVEEALSAGLIGHDIYEKLLSAERGVTGYKDPYTEQKISLFQALKKDLIVKDHGIRLLEAQIATGGIIDPVHSHRVPVEVAYKRGYFDEEMNQILSDPSDDTKGFFDPNTHENLTYLQLLQRCVQDPKTSLFMLNVNDNKSSLQIEQQSKSVLKSSTVRVTELEDKEYSLWDLLFSQHITEQRREELLKKYHAGTLTIEELTTIIITIIKESKKTERDASTQEDWKIQESLQSVHIDISGEGIHEAFSSVWDFLNSHYVSEDERKDLLVKFKSGTLTIEEIIKIITTIIQKKRTETIQDVNTETPQLIQETKVSTTSSDAAQWPSENELQEALKVIPSEIAEHPTKEQTQGTSVSVWDLLHSETVSEGQRQELLQTCKFTVNEIMRTCTSTITEGEGTTKNTPAHPEYMEETLKIHPHTLNIWRRLEEPLKRHPHILNI